MSEQGQKFVRVDYLDPVAAPLLKDLEHEYDARYGSVMGEPAIKEIHRYPLESFAPPSGSFLLLLEAGVPISGGAMMRYDDSTAEFKRIWTAPDQRGLGLAGRVLRELEEEAVRLGYERVYLTTGPRQPEAVRLYLKNGYTPLFNPKDAPEEIGEHAFEKQVAVHQRPARESRTSRPQRAELSGPQSAGQAVSGCVQVGADDHPWPTTP